MKSTLKNIIDYFSKKPRTLFLVDGLGAAWTAFSLYFIVRNFYNYLGMPADILTYLSVFGLIYCAYSLSCYFLCKNSWSLLLRIIGICNCIYCVVTMLLLFVFNIEITLLGYIYFFAEILIILPLAFLELQVAKRVRINITVKPNSQNY